MRDIIFISDYVCPYCLVAKKALEAAIAHHGIDAKVTYLPFELTPEPGKRVDTYHDEVRRSHYQILVEPCRQLGLNMKLPPNVVPRPYTRLAFEGWFYAKKHGKGDEYNEMVYLAYFIEEQDIGELDVLAGIAERVGLDREDFRRALLDGVYTKQERETIQSVRETYEVRHVPTIFVDGTEAEVENYTEEEFAALLAGEADDGKMGFHCTEDGCGF